MSARAAWPLAAIAAVAAVAVALAAVACDGAAPERASGGLAEIRIEWVYGEGFPGALAVHEALDGQRPGETALWAQGEEPEVGPEIPDRTLHARFGDVARFVAVYRNDTDEAVEFWVTPHLPVPYDAERGLVIQCLCTGAVYRVPPGETWTRVMAAGLNRRGDTAGPVSLVHAVIPGEPPGTRR